MMADRLPIQPPPISDQSSVLYAEEENPMLSLTRLPYRTIKALRSCCLTLVVLVLVLLVAGCVSLVFMAGRASGM
jgi:hypothetical protein